MSLFATSLEYLPRLQGASIGLVLMIKWTVVLALAWLAHAILAARNPRWRVALWRSAIFGLAIVAVLSASPPIVTIDSGRQDRRSVEPTKTGADLAPQNGPRAPVIIVESEPTVPIRPVTVAVSSILTIRRDEPPLALAQSRPKDFRGKPGSPRGCGRSGWPAFLR